MEMALSNRSASSSSASSSPLLSEIERPVAWNSMLAPTVLPADSSAWLYSPASELQAEQGER